MNIATLFKTVVAVWYLQLPKQSVPITINVVGSTPAQGEVYNIMW